MVSDAEALVNSLEQEVSGVKLFPSSTSKDMSPRRVALALEYRRAFEKAVMALIRAGRREMDQMAGDVKGDVKKNIKENTSEKKSEKLSGGRDMKEEL